MNGDDPIRFDKENRGLIIPVKEDDFRRFITSLLGRPQTITKELVIRFEITRDDIESCFQLVHQRVMQQNDANLVQFSVNIEYDDGSSVICNNLYDFKMYREVRDIASVGAELSWTYLIRFAQSNVPEKQTVELSLSTSRRRTRHESFNPLVSPLVAAIRRQAGNVVIRVEHTARSWGADIENLLTGQVERWDIPRPKVESLVVRHSTLLSFFASFSFATFAWYWLYRVTQPVYEKFVESVDRVERLSENEKINFMLDALKFNPAQSIVQKAVVGAMIVFIASIALWVKLSEIAEIPAGSHILLSDKSQRTLDIENKDRRWSLKYFIGSAIASTFAGVASKYLISFLH